MTEPSAEAKEQAQKIVNGWANQRTVADRNVNLGDLRDRIARALAEKDAELTEAREAVVFLRDHYSPIGGRACPACLYEGGTFIRWCKLHEEIAGLLDALDDDVAETRAKLADAMAILTDWRNIDSVQVVALKHEAEKRAVVLAASLTAMRGRMQAALDAMRADVQHDVTPGENACYGILEDALASDAGAAWRATVSDVAKPDS